jgi:hypothetical protein
MQLFRQVLLKYVKWLLGEKLSLPSVSSVSVMADSQKFLKKNLASRAQSLKFEGYRRFRIIIK